MAPEGWNHMRLDSVASVIDCKHRTPKYVPKGIPLVSPGTIKWGPLDLQAPVKHVSNEEYESLMDHCEVSTGDLVLSRNQSVGIASYVWNDSPFVLGQDTVLVKPLSVSSKYLFYSLQSEITQRLIFKLAGGSTFSRINLSEIRKLTGLYPPLEEQKKIAKILQTWDRAIATTEKLIEASKQQKKALMQQLLTGKKRFPGFEGEWDNGKLSDLATKVGSGITPKGGSSSYKDNGTPLIRSQNVLWGKLDLSDVVYIDEKQHQKMKGSIVQEGDVLLNITGASIGRVALSNIFEANVNQHVCIIRCNSKLSSAFLQFFLLSFSGQKLIEQCQAGGNRQGLNFEQIKSFRLSFPSLDEQEKIAGVITSADNELSCLSNKLTHLKQEKKALMQQLLTGKRRVKIDA